MKIKAAQIRSGIARKQTKQRSEQKKTLSRCFRFSVLVIFAALASIQLVFYLQPYKPSKTYMSSFYEIFRGIFRALSTSEAPTEKNSIEDLIKDVYTKTVVKKEATEDISQSEVAAKQHTVSTEQQPTAKSSDHALKVEVEAANPAPPLAVQLRAEEANSALIQNPDIVPKQHVAGVIAADKFRNKGGGGSISWDSFLQSPGGDAPILSNAKTPFERLVEEAVPVKRRCPKSVDIRLNGPSMRREDLDWCKWATRKDGGGVEVGKSWGQLKKDAAGRVRYETLQCDLVAKGGKVPSCNEGWGDARIANWTSLKFPGASCSLRGKSTVNCYGHAGMEKFCVINKAQINFNMMREASKSRKIDRGFISAQCDAQDEGQEKSYFPFKNIFSPKLVKDACDVVVNKTVIMYMHDHIDNLCHTMQDTMNIWALAWLDGKARIAKTVPVLNIDTLNQYGNGHYHNDQPNSFFETYYRGFETVIPGSSYGAKTVCFDRLIVQSMPPMRFVWENWEKDAPCSFIGPSTLSQRFNLQVRQNYGLLSAQKLEQPNKQFQILFVVRSESKNPWGSLRSSRIIKNFDKAELTLEQAFTIKSRETGIEIKLVVQDMGKLPYSEQIELTSRSSIIVGVHGAGMSTLVHMPIGTEYCCGLLEIFPRGEFTPARGYGNMARRTGIHYSRIDVSPDSSQPDGLFIPLDELKENMLTLIDGIMKAPTCVLSSVVTDPYLEKK